MLSVYVFHVGSIIRSLLEQTTALTWLYCMVCLHVFHMWFPVKNATWLQSFL